MDAIRDIWTREVPVLDATVGQYILFATIIFVGYLAARIVKLVLGRLLARQRREQGRTKLDEEILAAVINPIYYVLVVTGVWIGLAYLPLSEETNSVVQRVFLVFVTFVGAWAGLRIYDAFVGEFVEPLVSKTETKLDDQLLPIIHKSGRFAIVVLAAVVALSNAGYDVVSLIAGLGIGGLAFALAAQDTISHMFGGVQIFADQPFQIGDLITVSDFTGTVETVGLRTTRLRTVEDTLVVIPNGDIAGSKIENLSARSRRRVLITIGLTYDTTVEKIKEAKELIIACIDEDEHTDEGPSVSFVEFGDFALGLRVQYHAKDADWNEYLAMQDRVNLRIHGRFAEAGIDMAFPTQTVYTIAQNAGN